MLFSLFLLVDWWNAKKCIYNDIYEKALIRMSLYHSFKGPNEVSLQFNFTTQEL